MHTCDILWASLESITLIGLMMQQRVMSRVYLSPSQLRTQRSMVSRRHKGQANKRQIRGSFHIFHLLLCVYEAEAKRPRMQIWMDPYLRRRCWFEWIFFLSDCLSHWFVCRAIPAEFAKRTATLVQCLQSGFWRNCHSFNCRTSQVDRPSSSISRRVQTNLNHLLDSFLNLPISPKATGHAMLKPAPEEAVKGRKKKRWKSRPAVSSPKGSSRILIGIKEDNKGMSVLKLFTSSTCQARLVWGSCSSFLKLKENSALSETSKVSPQDLRSLGHLQRIVRNAAIPQLIAKCGMAPFLKWGPHLICTVPRGRSQRKVAPCEIGWNWQIVFGCIQRNILVDSGWLDCLLVDLLILHVLHESTRPTNSAFPQLYRCFLHENREQPATETCTGLVNFRSHRC